MSKISVDNGIDVVVSFDTTASMYAVLSNVRNQVQEFVRNMFETFDDIRIGIIAHGDYCDHDDPYTIRILDLTQDKEKLCSFIRETKGTYGGDADECYELVLNKARTTISWMAGREKVFIVIGDAAPHGVNYSMNTDRLDWKNEAGLLNELGVKIYAVHALSNYRKSSKGFYTSIAGMTDGKYLTLDQFNEIIDLIKATCISQYYTEEKLDEFVSVIRAKGRMTKTLASNIRTLSNGRIDTGYSTVQKSGLIPVVPGRFQVMTVDENCDIRGFVTKNGIEFKRGRGFYELTKHETVQQYKEVIIQDRETGEMFTGAQVRERLGLEPQIAKGGVRESLSSRDTEEFRVFVQSTSFNRKLIAGTTFLYEVSDLDATGTVISEDDKEVKPVKAEKPVKTTKTEKGVATKSKTRKPIKKTKAEDEKESDKPKKKACSTRAKEKSKTDAMMIADAKVNEVKALVNILKLQRVSQDEIKDMLNSIIDGLNKLL